MSFFEHCIKFNDPAYEDYLNDVLFNEFVAKTTFFLSMTLFRIFIFIKKKMAS